MTPNEIAVMLSLEEISLLRTGLSVALQESYIDEDDIDTMFLIDKLIAAKKALEHK